MGETTAKTTEKAPKAPKKSWFRGLKAEFKKIVWPDKDSLVKQSAAVIAISIVLSLIIAALDAVIKFGVNLLPIV
ncbi:MAG: preprotein translocase subunit SecE [Lachnospiraceae bacterium]|nr:preprotein translocase subunit SecE [Lachnospiraceae bacterium]